MRAVFCFLLLIALGSTAHVFGRTDRVRDRIFKKAFVKRNGGLANDLIEPKLFWQSDALEEVTTVPLLGSVMLECSAAGNPPPTIHWLLNGERVVQAYSSELNAIEQIGDGDGDGRVVSLGLSSTKSRLYVDCALPQREATYTCVAETPYRRLSQSTRLVVDSESLDTTSVCAAKVKRHSISNLPMQERSVIAAESSPARVTMWTSNRLEQQSGDIVLFCRASGSPAPHVQWLNQFGHKVARSDKYVPLSNGDLLIRRLSWTDMGLYTCQAQNSLGSDAVNTFVYPTKL